MSYPSHCRESVSRRTSIFSFLFGLISCFSRFSSTFSVPVLYFNVRDDHGSILDLLSVWSLIPQLYQGSLPLRSDDLCHDCCDDSLF